MTWLLVDGNNLAKRCKHSNSYLSTSKGKLSGTISGFLLGLMHAGNQARVNKKQMIVTWDVGRPKWRMELCPEYKAQRKRDDPDDKEYQSYLRQLIDLQALLDSVGIRQVKIPGVEADDIIAAIATQIYKDDECVIYSNDDDFLQFYETCGRIKIYNPSKRKFTTDEMMIKKFGFPDGKFVPLFKAIVGDSSDNIKGVMGIGKKRAIQALPFITVCPASGTIVVSSEAGGNGPKYAATIQRSADVVVRNMKIIDLVLGLRTEVLAEVSHLMRAPLSTDMDVAYRVIRDYELLDVGSRFMEW